MRRLVYSFVLSLSLVGCTVVPNEDAIGPYPENYKALIQRHIKETYFDPYSIKSAEIAMPVRGHFFGSQGWYICVKSNAKNRMGAYVGVRKTAYLINREKIIHIDERPNFCNVPNVAYRDWKDIENMQ